MHNFSACQQRLPAHGVQPAHVLALMPLLLCVAHIARSSRRRPSFLELGAYNGVANSNTLMLEKCHGWRGVLIEGNPTSFAALQRSGRNASMVWSAVSSTCSAGVANFTTRSTELAGIREVTEPNLRKYHHLRAVARPDSFGTVPCATLRELLSAQPLAATGLDFFSLDVEGSEDLVLASLLESEHASRVSPAHAVLPRVVLAEATDGQAPKNERVENMLIKAGYRRHPALEVIQPKTQSTRNRVYTHGPVSSNCVAAVASRAPR